MNGLPTFVHLNVIASEFGMFFSQPSADGSVPTCHVVSIKKVALQVSIPEHSRDRKSVV